MGLETVNFISDLTPTWPTASESKSQGDDHIRAIKTGVKNTFPNASRAFYFPVTEAITGTLSLDATDWNNIVEVDTTAGNVTVNLPSTLGAADKGWSCEVIKVSTDANGVKITPAAGTILTKVGSVATVRVGVLCEAAKFIWNGTGWRCHKPGPMIGSTEEYNGASLPPGYLFEAGGTFTAADFAELALVMGGNTLFDKRGRTSFAKDNLGGVAANRIGNTGSGLAAPNTLGTGFGEDATLVAQANLPNVNFTLTVNIVDPGHFHTTSVYNPSGGANTQSGLSFATGFTGIASDTKTTGITANGTAASGGSGTKLTNLAPGIIVNKIIRAC